METSLKTGFAQIFSCCPKKLSCPKFGAAAGPLAPRPVRLCAKAKPHCGLINLASSSSGKEYFRELRSSQIHFKYLSTKFFGLGSWLNSGLHIAKYFRWFALSSLKFLRIIWFVKMHPQNNSQVSPHVVQHTIFLVYESTVTECKMRFNN